MPDRPLIMVSNDDGHQSEGLAALVEALDDLAEVWVVAPESEQSATSHSISLTRPLRLREIRPRWYAVDGTPTDCSWMGVHHLLKGRPPTLVVSGINHGPNLADDVIYSGTVAAAMEAAIIGVPSIAVSLCTRQDFEFGPSARFAHALVEAALAEPLPPNMLLNVNVPPGEPDGYIVSRQGKHSYGADVVEKLDPRGRPYYWIGGNEYQHEDLPGSDCNAVLEDGRVAVTPLTLDLTDYSMRGRIEKWNLKNFRRHEG